MLFLEFKNEFQKLLKKLNKLDTIIQQQIRWRKSKWKFQRRLNNLFFMLEKKETRIINEGTWLIFQEEVFSIKVMMEQEFEWISLEINHKKSKSSTKSRKIRLSSKKFRVDRRRNKRLLSNKKKKRNLPSLSIQLQFQYRSNRRQDGMQRNI